LTATTRPTRQTPVRRQPDCSAARIARKAELRRSIRLPAQFQIPRVADLRRERWPISSRDAGHAKSAPPDRDHSIVGMTSIAKLPERPDQIYFPTKESYAGGTKWTIDMTRGSAALRSHSFRPVTLSAYAGDRNCSRQAGGMTMSGVIVALLAGSVGGMAIWAMVFALATTVSKWTD